MHNAQSQQIIINYTYVYSLHTSNPPTIRCVRSAGCQLRQSTPINCSATQQPKCETIAACSCIAWWIARANILNRLIKSVLVCIFFLFPTHFFSFNFSIGFDFLRRLIAFSLWKSAKNRLFVFFSCIHVVQKANDKYYYCRSINSGFHFFCSPLQHSMMCVEKIMDSSNKIEWR